MPASAREKKKKYNNYVTKYTTVSITSNVKRALRGKVMLSLLHSGTCVSNSQPDLREYKRTVGLYYSVQETWPGQASKN